MELRHEFRVDSKFRVDPPSTGSVVLALSRVKIVQIQETSASLPLCPHSAHTHSPLSKFGHSPVDKSDAE